jgi:hypothetical protein
VKVISPPGFSILANESIHPQEGELLSGLLCFDADDRLIWPAEQLQAFLQFQLGARLCATQWSTLGDLPLETYGDLLHHPRPLLALLIQTKDQAKRHYSDHDSYLPPEIWLLVYYGCILAAELRCSRRISRLPDSELIASINWALRQPWLGTSTRRLFAQGLHHLHLPRGRWRTH